MKKKILIVTAAAALVLSACTQDKAASVSAGETTVSADNKDSAESAAAAGEGRSGDKAADGSGKPLTAGYENAVAVVLSDDGITAGGELVGSKDEGKPVYLSSDVVYYEDRDKYDSGNLYGEGLEDEKHSAKDAEACKVVNITAAGTYILSGKLSNGQIRIDLGEDASKNPEAVVRLVLDNADISCEVAPAVIFQNVYECGNGWATETAKAEVDTSAAGANVVLADGSVNNIKGSHVAKIYKDNADQKKLWKQDGAFYSYMSLNIDGQEDGTGILNIVADNEGLDSELHLTVNGGNINIYSGDDGINTNEDGVSVTTINGGSLHIVAGLGKEGDGIDSNGWLVINGGTVVAMANPASDAGLDSDMGSYINGGTVVALGSTMDWAESDSEQVTNNLQFSEYKDAGDAIIFTDKDGNAVFAYDPSEDEIAEGRTRKFMGAIISCPGFKTGDTYNLLLGGTVNGSETGGIYDISTVSSIEGAVLQAYTGTDVRMGPGGFGGGRPDFDPEKAGEFKDFNGERPDFRPGDRPDGSDGSGERDKTGLRPGKAQSGGNNNGEADAGDKGGRPFGNRPDFDPSKAWEPAEKDRPEGGRPDGERPDWDDGGNPPMPPVWTSGDEGAPNTEFFMQDKVNNFSGIKNFDATEQKTGNS